MKPIQIHLNPTISGSSPVSVLLILSYSNSPTTSLPSLKENALTIVTAPNTIRTRAPTASSSSAKGQIKRHRFSTLPWSDTATGCVRTRPSSAKWDEDMELRPESRVRSPFLAQARGQVGEDRRRGIDSGAFHTVWQVVRLPYPKTYAGPLLVRTWGDCDLIKWREFSKTGQYNGHLVDLGN